MQQRGFRRIPTPDWPVLRIQRLNKPRGRCRTSVRKPDTLLIPVDRSRATNSALFLRYAAMFANCTIAQHPPPLHWQCRQNRAAPGRGFAQAARPAGSRALCALSASRQRSSDRHGSTAPTARRSRGRLHRESTRRSGSGGLGATVRGPDAMQAGEVSARRSGRTPAAGTHESSSAHNSPTFQ